MRATPQQSTVPTRQQVGSLRQWAFRALAVILGLTPLLGFELLCRTLDWGAPDVHDDPFVGFRDVRPLFVLNPKTSRFEIPSARQDFFCPESFPATKAENEYRVFCLGGSTVQGRPFAIQTSFTTWLELSLQAADPSRRWDVINCGGVSYSSFRLIPILQEVLAYEPDLIIFYEGHNEFLEDRTFHHLKNPGIIKGVPLSLAARLRTFTVMREGVLRLKGRSSSEPPQGRPILPTEVDALLDYRGGLEHYHWDPEWRETVIEQFAFNLRRIAQLTHEANVRLVFVNPVNNLKDSPPFKSEHRGDLSDAERQEWNNLTATAFDLLKAKVRDLPEAIRLMERACEIDPQHAGAAYHLAQCYHAAGRMDEARMAFVRAKELDVCPLRILEPMSQAIFDVADETETPLLDADELFRVRERDGIPGGYWLIDHVHPTVAGHQLIAEGLAELFVSLGIVKPRADWKATQERTFDEYLSTLDDLYFNRGMSRLNAERGWARGRSQLLRPGSKPTSQSAAAPVEVDRSAVGSLSQRKSN
ncbi:MAG: tetratricopeptide repeat protein [Planctomycetaceae bacterium]|nr:tetratricopeptide repeat protein [Planctomycetaceae bacterium]